MSGQSAPATMKILFDEGVPWDLADSFPGTIEVSIAERIGWKSKPNGFLLRQADEHGYDGLVTRDANMESQQGRPPPCPVFVVRAKKQDDLEYLERIVTSYILPALEAGAEKRYHWLGYGFERPDYAPDLPDREG